MAVGRLEPARIASAGGRPAPPASRACGPRLAAAAREDVCPACWGGQQAVVALPERLGVAKAGQVRAELLAVVDRGAAELIADMTATIFCDHAGQDGVARTISRHRHAGPADGPGWLGSAAGMAVRDVHVAHAGEHDRDA